jgi:predicted Zn-dependent protease
MIEQGNALHKALAPAVVSEEARLRGYVQQIATRLLGAAKDVAKERSLGRDESVDWMFSREMQFYIARSGLPNAFASGGNQVYVLVGAMQKCSSEDELAAAMAHAYAHTLLGHAREMVGPGAADAPAGSIVTRFIEHRYTPRQEQDADDLAFAIHARAGWDPVAFVSMLEHLEADKGRVAAIQARLEKLPPAAQEWSRPPISDVRRFTEHREQAGSTAASKKVPQGVERLLIAMPNCFLPQDLPVQKEAQRDLMTPTSTETPNTFEKGQRR